MWIAAAPQLHAVLKPSRSGRARAFGHSREHVSALLARTFGGFPGTPYVSITNGELIFSLSNPERMRDRGSGGQCCGFWVPRQTRSSSAGARAGSNLVCVRKVMQWPTGFEILSTAPPGPRDESSPVGLYSRCPAGRGNSTHAKGTWPVRYSSIAIGPAGRSASAARDRRGCLCKREGFSTPAPHRLLVQSTGLR